MKKNLIQIGLSLALALAFLGHSAQIYRIPLLNTLDAFAYDARLRLTLKGGVDERIVIVDVDEKSLAEIGRWPWNREKMARLVIGLFDEYRISILGFDAVFAEADTSSGLSSLEAIVSTSRELQGDAVFQAALSELRVSLDYDRLFAGALKGRRVVMGYSFTNHTPAHKSGLLPRAAVAPETFKGKKIAFTSWNGYGANLAEFQTVAASAGHFNPIVDADGISRRVPMLVEHEGNHYESLPLAMARVLLGNPPVIPGYPGEAAYSREDYSGLEWLDLQAQRGNLRIPVDEQVASLIPYRGAQGSFRYVSASDVLNGKLKPAQLQGKIVILGTSAPGLVDLRATPVGATYPGVEIHANMLAGILDQSIGEKPEYLVGAEVVLLTVCALLLAILLPILSPLRATLLMLCLLTATIMLNFSLWETHLAMPLASSVALILALYGPNMSWGYFVASRSKRQFTDLFGQYVPPELVDMMALDPERYSMEGKNAELTVLFSDVRGFTSISEGMDPKELSHLMNAYLGAMTEVVRKNRGTLDKYIGDAIMAFWGAPVADADHARNAVLTALEMQHALRKLDKPFRKRGWPNLQIGVGINTGMMTVGDMGSPVRKSYTVMGDAVNLGSRLEGITKLYGVGIVVSESTRALAQDIAYRELDRVRVKGKDEAVGIYEPVGLLAEIDKAVLGELNLWRLTLRLYRARDWGQAELQLRMLLIMNSNCHLYRLYAERLVRLREHPPDDAWDGVTTIDVK
jgi:adenylate cyclase